MNATIRYVLLCILAGTLLGYAFFGKVAGSYIHPTKLFAVPQNELVNFAQRLTGVSQARNNVLISALVGGVAGAVLTAIGKKK